MKHAPCKSCKRRGCGSYHDQCPAYQEWAAEMERQRQAASQEAIIDNVVMKHRHVAYAIWAKKGRKRLGNKYE